MKFEFSSGVIVINNGAILFLEREGWLDLPKGKIEKQENSLKAALRELFEETGIKEGEVSIDPFFEYTLKYFFVENGEKVSKRVKFFLGETTKKDIKVSFEHKGYRWVPFQDVFKEVKFENTKKMMEYVLLYLDKKAKIAQLNKEYSERIIKFIKENNMPLSTNFVPGEGNYNADIFIVGQAPGKEEDALKRPFVGKAGELLDKILKKSRIKRKECYITSVVQFFPFENIVPPEPVVEKSLPFLKRQIDIINPKIVVLMGELASRSFGFSLKERGLHAPAKEGNPSFFVTYHPAAFLHGNKKVKEYLEQDYKKIKAFVEALENQANGEKQSSKKKIK